RTRQLYTFPLTTERFFVPAICGAISYVGSVVKYKTRKGNTPHARCIAWVLTPDTNRRNHALQHPSTTPPAPHHRPEHPSPPQQTKIVATQTRAPHRNIRTPSRQLRTRQTRNSIG